MSLTADLLFTGNLECTIQLHTSLGDVDLHNFAHFVGLQYTTDGTLSLRWISSARRKFRIGRTPIERADLVFEDVGPLTILPRDPEMPREEDRTLDHFEIDELSSERCHMRIRFHGGMRIIVTAARVRLVVVPEVD